jgi:predicted signal transduction protein with EAL and GGDEF domain
LAEPFHPGSHALVITASAGIGRFPEHGATADEILRNADMAMYQAKRGGKNSFCVFDPNLADAANEQLEIDHLLRTALDKGEFSLVYQPQVAACGEIAGAEALLRWESPILGTVSPAHFIPVAEENGSIISIGLWVLRSACIQAARWHAEGHSIRIAVNVSACQFTRSDFAGNVAAILEETKLPPASLELELTETCVMQDLDGCMKQMRRIRQMGVRIALDDFGVGNSSLSRLGLLPLDTLKIDRSFIREMAEANGIPVVQAILTLARGLFLETVAEGVEYKHQNEVLQAKNCGLIQGYYFFKPMKAEALLAELRGPDSTLAPRFATAKKTDGTRIAGLLAPIDPAVVLQVV